MNCKFTTPASRSELAERYGTENEREMYSKKNSIFVVFVVYGGWRCVACLLNDFLRNFT